MKQTFLFSTILYLSTGGDALLSSRSHRQVVTQARTLQSLKEREVSSYSETDAASKGIVSVLTNIFNAQQPIEVESKRQKKLDPPTSSRELLDRIRQDYEINNYLWTGKLDLDCFDENCRFTDPTISFEGTEKFKQNTDNLVPLVTRFVENYQSILLDIEMTDEYVQTRWNMVGELNGLFWKPKIDVIGRTKFWYNPKDFLVYFYDECWEVPAYQALLQIVTPANTFPNSLATDASK
eukprot:scaffold25954_cov137-Cylindrotheca_fusiformis.AAC.3